MAGAVVADRELADPEFRFVCWADSPATVEAMEGHAVLSACLDEGVPALELRVVSNEIEEADRGLWRFDDAFAELARATALVIAELERA